MIIREVDLKNFGRFCDRKFSFSEGLNVIYGANEAGKTTVYQAINALLFGLEKQRGRAARNDTYTTYQPWENKTWYEGAMRFTTGGKEFSLERGFYHTDKSARLVCETDGEELSVPQGDLHMLCGEVSAELFYNTAAVGQLKMKPQDIVYSYLKNHIAGVQEAGSQATDVVKALAILDAKKKALEQQKKKQTMELNELLSKADARLELIIKEISDCEAQKKAVAQEQRLLATESRPQAVGFFQRLLRWLRNLFLRKRLRAERLQRREAQLKLQEKQRFLQELLGEKESLREEVELEKETYYEKLHALSKNKEIEAIELAQERIREISMHGSEEVMDELLKKSSAVLQRLTNGKYEKLILEENMEPAVWDGNRKIQLFQLSSGCVDQVYLALRIGLQDLFFEEDVLPLMFDDAFVYFDEQRLERLLLYLNGLGRQVLLFTCHQREMAILEKNGISYGKILL